MVKECVRCLYTSNHPLGIVFDDEGICSGCRIHEEKDQLDWNARKNELEQLVKPYRSFEAKYDCIVPVCGAKDSFYILHLVVHVLKLKPLVVSYNKYFNTPEGIANLARLRIAFDVDFQLKNVDPSVVKKITKKSIYAHGNPYWHCLAGETVFPVQTAVMMGISLIIWGAHQGLEQVGMFSHLNNVEMSRRYRKDHDLFGVEAQNMVGPFDDLTEEDVINYRYPAFSDIEALGVRGIYLGNYFRWDQYAQHCQMVKQFDYKGKSLARTFDSYDHADCYVYSNFHDMLKMYKHGYSKVTDQVCREIRFGRIDREKGEKIVAHYEAQPPAHIDLFCDWLGVDPASLLFSANRHRSRLHWTEVEPDIWERNKPATGVDSSVMDDFSLAYPNVPSPRESNHTEKYTTIGKGVDWPERNKDNAKSLEWI